MYFSHRATDTVANLQKGQEKEKLYAKILTFRIFSKKDIILLTLKMVRNENGKSICIVRLGA